MCEVSIVLPVYNGEKYLSKAIESIINQTFTDWELIIVNDGSTDDSLSIMNDYAKKDNRICIINNKTNKKLPATLNIGFSKAKGKYLTWTSHDNRYKENALQIMYEYLERNSVCGMVAADCILEWDSTGETEILQILNIDLRYASTIGACFMYRKSIADEIGEYDENMFLVEDYDYWLRIYRNYKIDRIPICLYYYLKHDKSLSISRRKDVIKQFFYIRKKHQDIVFKDIDKKTLINLFFETYFYVDDKKEQEKLFIKYGLDEKYIKMLNNDNKPDINKKYILFGAGNAGKDLFNILGEEKIECFADNNVLKIGQTYCGKSIISARDLKKINKEYNIVISTVIGSMIIEQMEQLNNDGILNYWLYWNVF